MKISLIAALDEKKGIGKNGKLPWHISEDLKHFKELTKGHTVIMGRKTFESIGKALPGRKNIIITSDRNYASKALDCAIASSVDDAIEKAKSFEGNEIFVIGGAEIYQQFLPMTEKIYLTLVHQECEGDAFFPKFNLAEWEEAQHSDSKDCSFVTLVKKQSHA